MKYGLVWIISSFSLSGIVPFKWSSPTSLMTFFFCQHFACCLFCPEVGAAEKMTAPCSKLSAWDLLLQLHLTSAEHPNLLGLWDDRK